MKKWMIIGAIALFTLPAIVCAGQFGDFTYTSSGGEVTITDYTGSGGEIAVPGVINGMPVATIGDHAFYDCDALTGITFPDSVTTLGDYAFENCNGLTSTPSRINCWVKLLELDPSIVCCKSPIHRQGNGISFFLPDFDLHFKG